MADHFKVLSKAPVRHVLLALDEHSGMIDLDKVGEETIMDAEKWGKHQVTLRHIHLPKLAEHDFIEWVDESRVIVLARGLLRTHRGSSTDNGTARVVS